MRRKGLWEKVVPASGRGNFEFVIRRCGTVSAADPYTNTKP